MMQTHSHSHSHLRAPAVPPMAAMQSAAPPIRVAALGIGAHQMRSLALALQGSDRGACVLTEEAQADAYILDMDSYQACSALQGLRERYPERPRLLLSLMHLEPSLVADDLVVGKPIRLTELVAQTAALRERALAASAGAARAPRRHGWGRPAAADSGASGRAAGLLDDRQGSALIGTAPDIDLADPAELTKAYYDPRRFLQGLVCEARDFALARGLGVRVLGPWPEIVLDPARGLAWAAGPDTQLRPYCVQPSVLHESHLDYVQRPAQGPDLRSTVALDAFVWKLALWASRGRLPVGTPLDAPVVLARWPNFTRLAVAPGAMRIAALWMHEPHSLIATVEALSLPQRAVFSFYSTAAALGLVHCQTSQTRTRPLPTAPGPRRGIIGRILRRLHVHP